MPYDVRIKDIDTSEEYKTTIDELKELKDILDTYNNKTIELEVINTDKIKEMKYGFKV